MLPHPNPASSSVHACGCTTQARTGAPTAQGGTPPYKTCSNKHGGPAADTPSTLLPGCTNPGPPPVPCCWPVVAPAPTKHTAQPSSTHALCSMPVPRALCMRYWRPHRRADTNLVPLGLTLCLCVQAPHSACGHLQMQLRPATALSHCAITHAGVGAVLAPNTTPQHALSLQGCTHWLVAGSAHNCHWALHACPRCQSPYMVVSCSPALHTPACRAVNLTQHTHTRCDPLFPPLSPRPPPAALPCFPPHQLPLSVSGAPSLTPPPSTPHGSHTPTPQRLQLGGPLSRQTPSRRSAGGRLLLQSP
jgi:hypothetical protein